MNSAELLAAIDYHIERPAFVRVQQLIGTGQMTIADAALFRSSAQVYKSALLSRYDGFDPRVRNALLSTLFGDYRREIDRLLVDVERRPVLLAMSVSVADGAAPGRSTGGASKSSGEKGNPTSPIDIARDGVAPGGSSTLAWVCRRWRSARRQMLVKLRGET